VRGLGPEETSGYLSVLTGLRGSCPFYDTHVHPYEVLFDRFSYEEQSDRSGVLSLPGKCYTAPAAGRFRFPEMADFNDEPRSQRLQDISAMLLRKVYGSVGEQVFLDQMELGGIDKVLLLPIATEAGDCDHFDARMRWVKRCYPNEDKFWIAGSVPGALGCEAIRGYAGDLQRQFGIRAIKFHPVVSGIDLGTGPRKQWLEMLLIACHELKLPLVIHGGRNNPYWGGSRGNFGALQHLKEINISLSQSPVILAHAGFHYCGVREIEMEALSVLEKMLKKHSNLYVDISGLGFEPLKRVLQSVESDRIVFGSDALYAPQWEAVTMTMHALKELGMKLEDSFVQFASINPQKTIFREDKPC
jgi:predicted TIM-barrel fold metal-dependent hydrolase